MNDTSDIFFDITIQTYNLTQDMFERLKAYHDYSSNETYLQFDNIKDAINGTGRVVIYTALAKTIDGKWDPTNDVSNQIDSLLEGNFLNGSLNGFGRIMYQGKNVNEYKCRLGYFIDNNLDGKGIYYTAG